MNDNFFVNKSIPFVFGAWNGPTPALFEVECESVLKGSQ